MERSFSGQELRGGVQREASKNGGVQREESILWAGRLGYLVPLPDSLNTTAERRTTLRSVLADRLPIGSIAQLVEGAVLRFHVAVDVCVRPIDGLAEKVD